MSYFYGAYECGTEINRLVCRKAAISALVDLYWVTLKARLCRLLVVKVGGGSLGGRGVFQRPLVSFSWPVIIMLSSLIFYIVLG